MEPGASKVCRASIASLKMGPPCSCMPMFAQSLATNVLKAGRTCSMRVRTSGEPFFAAAHKGDFEALVAVLDPDIVLRSDGGTGRPDSTMVVRGATEVASGALTFARHPTFTVRIDSPGGVIRGIHGRDLDEEGAYAIGRAFVEQFDPRAIAVGRDMRTSSPAMAAAEIEGAADAGAEVRGLGLVGTEMVYYAVGELGLDGGVCVTASHNPKEYTGMKIVRRGALPVGGDSGLLDVRTRAMADPGPPKDGGSIRPEDIWPRFVERVVMERLVAIRRRPHQAGNRIWVRAFFVFKFQIVSAAGLQIDFFGYDFRAAVLEFFNEQLSIDIDPNPAVTSKAQRVLARNRRRKLARPTHREILRG